MAANKPRGRRPWLDDMQLDESGKYAYRGSHMKFAGDDAAFRRFRLFLGICTAMLVLCPVAAGCLNVGVLDNTAYVLIPYMLEVVFTAAFAWASVRLLTKGSVVRSYIYKQTVQRLPVLCVLLAVAAGSTAVGAAVCSACENAWRGIVIVYLLLHTVECLLSVMAFFLLRHTSWSEI